MKSDLGKLSFFIFLRRKMAPVIELLIRLALAKSVLITGMMGMMSSSIGERVSTLSLLHGSLPASSLAFAISWLDIVAAMALACGFATRLAALTEIILMCVAAPDLGMSGDHVIALSLLFWIAFQGAGSLSMDQLLVKGLSTSALPFASQGVGILARFSQRTRSLCILLMRLGASYILLGAVFGPASVQQIALLPRAGRWISAVLLGLGLFSSATSACIAIIEAGTTAMLVHAISTMYWPLSLSLLAVVGPGSLSLDGMWRIVFRRPKPESRNWPHVVIVGAGFAGLACVARLRSRQVNVTLIDKRNFHLFQPLLYQVATASLSPGDIATPIRGHLRDASNVRVLYQSVTGVVTTSKVVVTDQGTVPYDFLVVATGASHGYFGHEEWAEFAPGLKTLEDALDIRRRVLSAFERAEFTGDPDERARLLTFVICGGGPTGVELAGALAELARNGLDGEYKNFDPRSARILLVQSGPRLLPAFSEKLSAAALSDLTSLGVSVRLNSRVGSVDATGVTIGAERIEAGLVLWAAGVVASPAARWLGQKPDSAGRVPVAADLSVPGCPGVFAIGDTASVSAWHGQPVPGLAQAAKQSGQYVAGRILSEVGMRPPPAPFVYRHRGSLATIGRKSAVAEFGRLQIQGAPAWWLWGALHLAFLVGGRNRLAVLFGWLWSYFTYGVGVQLITGDAERRSGPMARPGI
jgi:NADH dehydrogenase/putative oxidoreductase